MKGGGKYIRVWVYGANAEYLNNVENQSRTVNEALAAYSHMQSGNITIPLTDGTGTTIENLTSSTAVAPRSFNVSTTSLAANTYATPQPLVCDNGHLLNGVSGKCVGKMCEYAK